jgi:hypothetical protein
MPAPAEIRKRLAQKAVAAFEALIDEIWDHAASATLNDAAAKVQHIFFAGHGAAGRDSPAPEPAAQPTAGALRGHILYDHPTSLALMSPQKRGAQNRERKGVVKNAIREVIYQNDNGTSREGIRKAAQAQKGLVIKDGSLKQGLRLLQKAGEIENRNHLWFPKRNGGQSSD